LPLEWATSWSQKQTFLVLQCNKVGHWRDYMFGEGAHVLLSLVAKSALACQVYAGTLARGT
jgi:hypothetical protein